MAVLAGALFLVGYQWGNQWQRERSEPPRISGVLLRPPIALPDWRLEDPSGTEIGPAAFADDWVLLAFVSSDPLTRQLTMTRMIEVLNRLADRTALRERLRLALVTPSDAAGLARDFNRLLPTARVLSGTPEQRERLSALLAGPSVEPSPEPRAEPGAGDPVPGVRQEHEPEGPGAVTFYLIDPEGQLQVVFPAAQSAAEIAADLRALTDDEQ